MVNTTVALLQDRTYVLEEDSAAIFITKVPVAVCRQFARPWTDSCQFSAAAYVSTDSVFPGQLLIRKLQMHCCLCQTNSLLETQF